LQLLASRKPQVGTGQSAWKRLRSFIAAGLVLTGVCVIGVHYTTERGSVPRPPSTEASGTKEGVSPRSKLAPERAAPPPVLAGVVRSRAGGTVVRARVCAYSISSKAPLECVGSDGAGTFHLHARRTEALRLVASADHFLDGQLLLPAHGGDGPITVELTPNSTQLLGRVVDATGGAVEGAWVIATAKLDSTLRATTVAGSAGAFAVDATPGLIEVRAGFDGYTEARVDAVAPGHPLTLVLAPASSIAGRVVSVADRAPVAGVRVSVQGQNGAALLPGLVESDAEGEFRIPGLAAGAYELTASGGAHRSAPLWLELGIGERRTDVEIRVTAAASFTATISVQNAPCVAGRVDLAGPLALSGPTDEAGVASIPGVLPGHYVVTVSCSDGVPVRESVDIELEPVERSYELASGGAIQGTITTASGAPLAGAEISVSPTPKAGAPLDFGMATYRRCISSGEGRFACSGLAVGDYDCFASVAQSPVTSTVRLTLTHEAPLQSVALRARPSGSIRVQLESDRGVVGPVTVQAKKAQGRAQVARREGSQFVFEGLELGSYSVFAGLDEAPPRDARRVQLTRDGEQVEMTLELPVTGSIAGHVVDEQGNPLPDAWVSARPSAFGDDTTDPTPVLTDASGAFSLEGLLPGRYDVDVTAAAGDASVDGVSAGERELRVELARYSTLSGSLVSTNGDPVETFTVQYGRARSGLVSSVHGSRGQWSLPRVPPGTYLIQASVDGQRASATIELAPGAEREVPLALGSGAPIEAAAWELADSEQ
jgi:hypothetical protein